MPSGNGDYSDTFCIIWHPVLYIPVIRPNLGLCFKLGLYDRCTYDEESDYPLDVGYYTRWVIVLSPPGKE